jgi:centrin-1
MRALGFEIKKEELKNLMKEIDKEVSEANAHSVTVSQDEFLQMMSGKMASRDSREEIEKIFRLFDEENSGFITFKQLKKVCNELGEGLTDEEIQEMIDEADRDQDGKINMEEFYRVMKKRGENPLDDWDSDDD